MLCDTLCVYFARGCQQDATFQAPIRSTLTRRASWSLPTRCSGLAQRHALPGVPGAGLSMGGRRRQRRRTGSPARRNRQPRREGRTDPDKYERDARAAGSRAQRRARGGSQARGAQAVREIAFRCARGCAGGHSSGARGEKRGKPRAIWREFAKHPEAAASVLRAASDAFLRKHRLSRIPSRRGYVEWTRQFIFDVKH